MRADNPLARAILPVISDSLRTDPVLILTGARQTGKSTLAEMTGGDYTVFSLDERAFLEDAKSDPDEFVQRASKMIIDEVQRVPDLLYAIKRVIDTQKPRTPGRFLLTGSANLTLMQRVSESLAGRASYSTIWPMTRREVLGLGTTGIWSELLETEFRLWYDLIRDKTSPKEDWREVARRGGYPVPAHEHDENSTRQRWFRGYIKTYLQRDVPELSVIEHGPDLQRLMRAIALRVGQLQNQSELGRDVGLPQSTVHRYMNLLEISYQLVRLPAFTVNRTSRLIKAPKTYWNDTGLAMAISGENEPRGEHLENMVLSDLLAWKETVLDTPEIMYWRTAGGNEVDFVIEDVRGKLLPIEVKATTRPSTKMIKGLNAFTEEYYDKVHGSLVLYTGDDVFRIGPNTLAVPWWMVL